MKLAIVGSRTITDLPEIPECKMIITGGAKGADKLAEDYANKNGIELKVIKPDWSKGKCAGILRNEQIVNECDQLLALWDGKSKGTKSTIEMAIKKGKPIILYVNGVKVEQERI